VLQIISHNGDPTGNQPILYLGDPSRMIAVAEVYESDIKRLRGWLESSGKEGIAAEIERVPVLTNGLKLTGRLPKDGDKSITGMITRNQVFSLNPREDADRRVFEVRVEIEENDMKKAGQFIGMQVEVKLIPPGGLKASASGTRP
jgi:HlyD family secretion protein